MVRILVIEDNPDDYLIIREKLRNVRDRYELTNATLLFTGIELLKSGEFDIVLLDLTLPDSQGLETIITYRNHIQQIPVIILTGFEDKQLSVKAIEAGAQDYLVKNNIDSEVLIRVIDYSLRRFNINKELAGLVEEKTRDLKESEEKYRILIENFPNAGVFLFNGELEIIASGGSLNDNFGFVDKTKVENLFPGDINSNLLTSCKKALSGKKEELEFQLEDRFIKTLVHPLKSGKSSVFGMILAQDITEQKEAKIKIQESLEREKELNELKTRFIQQVSHEFRTPLTSILNSSQILNKYNKEIDDRIRESCFRRIIDSVESLTEMVDNLLLVQEFRSGQQAPEYRATDLKRVIDTVIEGMGDQKERIHFEFEVTERIGLEADQELIALIIKNILKNAIIHSPGEQTINIQIKLEDGNLIITALDAGSGIPQTDLNLLKSVSDTDDITGVTGAGIGIFIAGQITSMLDGKMLVSLEGSNSLLVKVLIPLDMSMKLQDEEQMAFQLNNCGLDI